MRRKQRAIDLAVLQAETAQLQVEALRSELAVLHQELARRDVELISALTRVAAVTDRLRLQTEQDREDHHRLTRAIELLTAFIATPPPALTAGVPTGPANDEFLPPPAAPPTSSAPPPGPAPTPPASPTEPNGFVATEPAATVGTVIGGSIDPSRLGADADTAIDLTTDPFAELPVAPATRAERPLRCEVHLKFGDRWIDGFQIEETVHDDAGTRFRLRRRVDGWVLPELFEESEVRVFTQPVVDG